MGPCHQAMQHPYGLGQWVSPNHANLCGFALGGTVSKPQRRRFSIRRLDCVTEGRWVGCGSSPPPAVFVSSICCCWGGFRINTYIYTLAVYLYTYMYDFMWLLSFCLLYKYMYVFVFWLTGPSVYTGLRTGERPDTGSGSQPGDRKHHRLG